MGHVAKIQITRWKQVSFTIPVAYGRHRLNTPSHTYPAVGHILSMKNTIITYGDGMVLTQQGQIDGLKCLTIQKQDKARPINSTPAQWDKTVPLDKVDVVILFKNIESARTLQDELNELISIWSKEQSQIVP